MTENLIGEAHRPGRIEVVCGSMFSGKAGDLVRKNRGIDPKNEACEVRQAEGGNL